MDSFGRLKDQDEDCNLRTGSLSLYGIEPGSPLLGGRFSLGKARKCRPKILDLTGGQARDLWTAVLPDALVVLGRVG